MIESLEWTRPWWLLALPAGIALLGVWWRSHAGARVWRALVDPELLVHLASRAPASSARLAFGIATVVLVLVCASLAGPVWRAQPGSPQRDSSVRIVVLDLSPSMDAIDVAPSRQERARQASAALLREAAGAQLGLVVFGADAFSVAPLTTDPAPLLHLLTGLNTATLPRAGSRPDLGLEMARTLLKQARAAAGNVILVGDSAGDARTLDAARALASAGFPLSVLAVGTAHGGPVPLNTGAFAKTEAGEILVATPDFAQLEQVARSGGGRFQLLPGKGETPRFTHGAQTPAWPNAAPFPAPATSHDGGAWLALLALPFAALLFRRGWLACFALLALPAPPAEALDGADLWRRADQQAAAAFARAVSSNYERLLDKLDAESPWHALLLYRGGRFAEAAARFAMHDTADAHYNRGNALAREGDLEAAIAAYDAALARNPAMQDALFNRALVRKALAQDAGQPEGNGAQPQDRRRARSPSSTRPEAPARGRTERPDSRGGAGEEKGAPPGRRQAHGSARKDGSEDAAMGPKDPNAAELQRLENLLSQVSDDPGSLLANRFARQLRMRGVPHRDTGARW